MRKFRIVAGVAALLALMLASTSCGSDPNLIFIQVIPSAETLSAQGQTAQFIANGVFERGPDQDITERVTWASSDVAVATVSNSSGSKGLATAGANCGSTTITASLDGKTDTATLTVALAVCP